MNKNTALLCTILTLFYLHIGLQPYNFMQNNGVNWIEERKSISFNGNGIAYILDAIINEKNKLTIELFFKGYSNDNTHMSKIITVCDKNWNEIFFVGQWKSYLIVRKTVPVEVNKNRYIEFGLFDSIIADQLHLITITSGQRGICFYLNGIKQKQYSKHALLEQLWPSKTRLIIGNSTTATKGWYGEVAGFAFYSKELDTDAINKHFKMWEDERNTIGQDINDATIINSFPGYSNSLGKKNKNEKYVLYIPDNLEILKKRWFISPWEEYIMEEIDTKDINVNLFGFIPFGIFGTVLLVFSNKKFYHVTGLFRKKKSSIKHADSHLRKIYFNVFLWGVMISFTIETCQIYLPSRYSELSDLLLNTIGTIFGIIVFHLFRFIARKLFLVKTV